MCVVSCLRKGINYLMSRGVTEATDRKTTDMKIKKKRKSIWFETIDN